MVRKKPKQSIEKEDVDLVVDGQAIDEPNEPSEKFWLRLKKRIRNEDDEPVIGVKGRFKDKENQLFNDVRPREGYYFHSDYYDMDDKVAKIVTFVNTGVGKKPLPAFWGINMIPQGLQQNVKVVLIKSVDKMTEQWIADHQKTADSVASFNENETKKSINRAQKKKAKSSSSDIDIIAEELADGAAYLNIHFRLLIYADDLDSLEKAEAAIIRWYVSKFATLKIEPYEGRQRRELSTLLGRNVDKSGRGFYLTSTELAGNYSLVTQGLSDATGSFLGNMVGDVNNSGVLMDIDHFDSHIVVASKKKFKRLNKQFMSDMWALKLSNSTLMNNKRVIHVVLNKADLVDIGMKRQDGSFIDLSGLTSHVNMNEGDVNPFEIFGTIDPETGVAADEIAAFSAHIEKLKLMLKQLYSADKTDESIIDNYMMKVVQQYYVDEEMWLDNAEQRRDDLRVVGLPHKSYPTLYSFVQALERHHLRELNKGEQRDPNDLKAVNIIKGVFAGLLQTNGDLFNVYTNDVIDDTDYSRRVIYDFSSLRERGVGLAMAQLVNILGFATKRLEDGDLLVIHGAEYVEKSVQEFVSQVIDVITSRGGRVAYIYNDVEKMLSERQFNHYDTADYTTLGYMSKPVFDQYTDMIKQSVPVTLENLVTSKHSHRFYVRRGTDNVVFEFDPRLVTRKEVS